MHIRTVFMAFPILAAALGFAPPSARAQTPAATQGPVKVTLDDAIQLALAHNHTLAAARSTIDQAVAQETTANLRPNPVLLGDAQFLPIFTCLGLLPAALSTGVGSDTQKPFAIVIVAGLISRLFIAIFVDPVLYRAVAREGDVLQV